LKSIYVIFTLHNHQKRATKTKFINGVGVPIWNCDDLHQTRE